MGAAGGGRGVQLNNLKELAASQLSPAGQRCLSHSLEKYTSFVFFAILIVVAVRLSSVCTMCTKQLDLFHLRHILQ